METSFAKSGINSFFRRRPEAGFFDFPQRNFPNENRENTKKKNFPADAISVLCVLCVLCALLRLLRRLLDCFNQVPFQQSQAKSTLAGLKSLVELYSFTDSAIDSGAPYNLKVDLRALISAMEAKVDANSYSNDYAFQKDVMDAFNPLNDAHTLYVAPNGYRCFLIRPFNIEAAVSGSDMQYTLREGPLGAQTKQVWSQIFGVDISPFQDKVVTAVNDMSVTDHIMGVAEHFISTYKDHGVRYNAALRGRWSQTLLSMFPLTDPHLDYGMKLEFADGTSVTLSNAAFCSGGISSTSGLLSKNKASGVANIDEVDKKMMLDHAERQHLLTRGVDIYKEMKKDFDTEMMAARVNTQPSAAAREAVNTAARQSTIVAHDLRPAKAAIGKEIHSLKGLRVPTARLPASFDAQYLKIVQKTYSYDTVYMVYNDTRNPVHYVLKLESFAPDDEDDSIRVIQALIGDAQKNGVEHLILDMAYNGGGIICMSDLLLALLVEDWQSLASNAPGLSYGIYDFRQSPTTDAIRGAPSLNRLFTAYTTYIDIDTKKVYTNDSFYGPIQRTRSGHTSPYTRQAYFPSECIDYPSASFRPIKYYFKHMTVLTDGTCGSACALFASQLQSFGYAKVVSYGGPLKRTVPLSTASFAGGNVLDYGTVAYYAYFYGNNAKGLPPMFTSSAMARFNFNEYYEFNDLNVPREFLKRPADVHLDYYATMFNDDLTTAAGKANTAALYAAVIAI